MEMSKRSTPPRSILFALIHGATYVPATWLLKNQYFTGSLAIIVAIIPIITFAIFIYKYIKAISAMDEVKQRIQFEAVVIGFSLTAMLVMLLFLLSLSGISNDGWFGYAHLVIYCWLFYFIGWFISKKRYGV